MSLSLDHNGAWRSSTHNHVECVVSSMSKLTIIERGLGRVSGFIIGVKIQNLPEWFTHITSVKFLVAVEALTYSRRHTYSSKVRWWTPVGSGRWELEGVSPRLWGEKEALLRSTNLLSCCSARFFTSMTILGLKGETSCLNLSFKATRKVSI